MLQILTGRGQPTVQRDGVQLSRAEDAARYAPCLAESGQRDGLGDPIRCAKSGKQHAGNHQGYSISMEPVYWPRDTEPDQTYWPAA